MGALVEVVRIKVEYVGPQDDVSGFVPFRALNWLRKLPFLPQRGPEDSHRSWTSVTGEIEGLVDELKL